MLKKKQGGKLVDGEVRQKLGRDVVVDVDAIENDASVVLATAVCGQTTVERSHKFGPVDGSFGVMPEDHVAASIEALIERSTREAAFHEGVRLQLEQFKQNKVQG